MDGKSGRESSIVDAILRELNGIPGCKAIKRHGSGMGRNGEPDITGCYYGKHFEIEVKRPGKDPERLQCQRLKEWEDAGASVGIAECIHSAVYIAFGRSREGGVWELAFINRINKWRDLLPRPPEDD